MTRGLECQAGQRPWREQVPPPAARPQPTATDKISTSVISFRLPLYLFSQSEQSINSSVICSTYANVCVLCVRVSIIFGLVFSM